MSKIVLHQYEGDFTHESYLDQMVVNIRFVISRYDMEDDGVRDSLQALLQHSPISIETLNPPIRDETRHEMEKEKQKASAKEDHQSDPSWGTW